MIIYYNVTKTIEVDDSYTDEQINTVVDVDSEGKATSWWKQEDEDKFRVTFCDDSGNVME